MPSKSSQGLSKLLYVFLLGTENIVGEGGDSSSGLNFSLCFS